MNDQPTLFEIPAESEKPVIDPVEARRVTELGVARSTAAAQEEWADEMRRYLDVVARRYPTFTSDELWVVAGREAVTKCNPSALGGVFRSAVKDGVMVATSERRESQRPDHHRKLLRVWKSRICAVAR